MSPAFRKFNDMIINIDTLKVTDLKGLKELYDNGFEGSKSDLDCMQKTYEKIKDNKDYIVLLAHIEDKIAGSVFGVICNELFGKGLPFMVVEDVVVLKEYRRKGIAKQLMLKLEDIAIQNKCSMIIFVSSAHRTGAHKLYESLGFADDKVNGYRKRLIKD